MTLDLDDLAGILRHAGQTEIAPRFRNLGAGDIAEKAHQYDLVTEADTGAERVITQALRERFPDALIVGEEAYAADKSILNGLAAAELAFVIDPVDGTFNFAAGSPVFGSLLAVVRRGETVGGLICDPMLGDVIAAEQGAGARLLRADGQSRLVQVARPAGLDTMVSVLCWSYLHEPVRSHVAASLARTRLALSLGCSAYEYWMLTTGRAHFGGAHEMMPWDHLAGVLIHAEAGGYSARFDGSPYGPGDTRGGLLCATDRDSWELVRQQIIGAA